MALNWVDVKLELSSPQKRFRVQRHSNQGPFEFACRVKIPRCVSSSTPPTEEDRVNAELIETVVKKFGRMKRKWNCHFSLQPDRSGASGNGDVLSVIGKSKLLDVLKELDSSVVVKLDLTLWCSRTLGRNPKCNMSTFRVSLNLVEIKETTATAPPKSSGTQLHFCQGELRVNDELNEDIQLKENLYRMFKEKNLKWTGEAKMWYSCRPAAHLVLTMPVSDPMAVCKRILRENLSCDVVISTKNGSKISCNKCFLIAQSEPLRVLLQQSDQVNFKIRMEEMDDDGVKAFLEFVYFWDLTAAHQNPRVAVQLLSASHKYSVEALQLAMKQLVLEKSNDWFGLDDVLEIFSVAEGDSELVQKAVDVMRAKGKGISSSPAFKALVSSDPAVALQLIEAAFTN